MLTLLDVRFSTSLMDQKGGFTASNGAWQRTRCENMCILGWDVVSRLVNSMFLAIQ
jgi:hypothetical protein